MNLKMVELIETEIGKMPVIINKQVVNDNVRYCGKIISDDFDISVESITKKDCLEELKVKFDLELFFWLTNQLDFFDNNKCE